MDTKYNELLPDAAKNILKSCDYVVKEKRTDIGVKVLEKPPGPGLLAWTIFQAMAEPVTIYMVDVSSPKKQFPMYLGDFVYANGGFRYIDRQVWQALSLAPPVRIRIGGNVAKANLVKQVDPIYSEEAKARGAEGDVLVHVVLGTDGTVKELNVIKGDPVLAKAAAEAIQQWRYKPTLLNGKAVEVDTTIAVIFSVNR
jgi:TonB family protein